MTHQGETVEEFLAASHAEVERLLADGRAAFDAGVDGTLGIEEEFALLDPVTLDLSPGWHDMRRVVDAADRSWHLTGELIAAEAEFRTGRCEDFAAAEAEIRGLRAEAGAYALEAGYRLGATGTHPWADYREQVSVDEPYYERLFERMGYVARRNNTFGLHVHCGVQGADRAIGVFDALRSYLPQLLSLSTSSPYLDGQDTGLCSSRVMTFSRTFPRAGIPPIFGDYEGYESLVRLLLDTGSIETYGQLWWGIRPHGKYGTVEIRMYEAQPDIDMTVALVAFGQGLVLALADLWDAGELPDPEPAHLLDENMWRATRWGVHGEFINIAAGAKVESTRSSIERTLAMVRETGERRGLGISDALEPIERALREGTAADRQRHVAAAGGGMRAAYEDVVQQTMSSAGTVASVRSSQ